MINLGDHEGLRPQSLLETEEKNKHSQGVQRTWKQIGDEEKFPELRDRRYIFLLLRSIVQPAW